MRVLIYSLGLPPFRRGGLVNYSVDLATQLAVRGHKVIFLYPGKMPFRSSHKVTFSKCYTKYPFECYEFVNPLPVSLTFGNGADPAPYCDTRNIQSFKKFINRISPDVVHFHTIMGLPIEYLEFLKKKEIKTVFTTHDYYGLCPKMLKEDSIEELKTSECSYDCMLCQPGPSMSKIKIMQSHFYQRFKNSSVVQMIRNKQRGNFNSDKHIYRYSKNQAEAQYQLRRYYLRMYSLFDCFHFNSSVAKSIYCQYLPKIRGQVVPLMIKGLKSHKKMHEIHNPVHIGFLGGTDPKKGFNELIQVCNGMNRNGLRFKLICAGSDSDNNFFHKDFVENLGIVQRDKIQSFYDNIDVLVVPSVWHETFGLVTLEALAQRIPVLCSDNVGSKDLLPDSCIFNNKDNFQIKLSKFISEIIYRINILKTIRSINIDMNFNNHVTSLVKHFYVTEQ